jgi:hypothetical protein
MDLDLLYTLGKIAGALVSIGGAIKYVPKWYRWLRSWKLIKRQEFKRLQALDAEQQKRTERIAKEIKATIEGSQEVKVDSDAQRFEGLFPKGK